MVVRSKGIHVFRACPIKHSIATRIKDRMDNSSTRTTGSTYHVARTVYELSKKGDVYFVSNNSFKTDKDGEELTDKEIEKGVFNYKRIYKREFVVFSVQNEVNKDLFQKSSALANIQSEKYDNIKKELEDTHLQLDKTKELNAVLEKKCSDYEKRLERMEQAMIDTVKASAGIKKITQV